MTNEATLNPLKTEPIGKLLLKFSIPAIVGMMVNALYNVVDRIYIGWIGPLAMTGIGLNLPFMTLLMAFSMLIGIGGAAIISIRLGEGNHDGAEKILGNAFTLLILIMAVVGIIGLSFKTPLLYLFGASDDTIGFANAYITIILFGAIFQGLGFGLNNIIRAEGNPKIAMYTMLLGAIANIVLDPIFIFVFKMGIAGAALATILSQLISAIWVLYHFLSGRSKLVLKRQNLKLDFAIIKSIFSIGMSPFFMQVAASIVTIVSNNALKNTGGDIAIGAMTVINAIVIVFLMPIFGLNQGSQPIIGFNYGAKQYDRVKQTLKLAIYAATAICLVAFIATQFFTVYLIQIFNRDPELVSVATSGMKIFLCMVPFIGFQVISSNYFQAVGKAPKAMFLSLLRQVIILIPMLVIMPRFFGLTGVWMAGPIADLSATVVTAIFIFNELSHLDDSHQLEMA
ncbi:MATE family efflux transporter [Fusibacter sp. 3D3]|uniref:MATE family efflux transporter n=1 Tax=Fusibacter sp. 3D3 TaxID=1048380 RepID=UPI0008530290|nr:MATE family efflux transporter [Fusibacter sp. 3D3]GAU75833.1 multi antimicrobial extrusion protein Na(+)/drug antiporter [Fusibacter sp. 3D3]